MTTAASPPDPDDQASFQALARELALPAELVTALTDLGYKTVADLGYSVPFESLPALLQAIPAETWEALQVADPAISPITGRLRRFLLRCHSLLPAAATPTSLPAAPSEHASLVCGS